MRTPFYRSVAIGLVLAGGLAAGACSPTIDLHGNLPTERKLAEIKPGTSDRSAVSEGLGTPSAVATFDTETWYYVSQKTKTFAFFEPEILEQRVIAVRFDSNGVVQSVDNYQLSDGRAIEPVDRKTPTAGKELGLFEQLLGNIGRFSKKDE